MAEQKKTVVKQAAKEGKKTAKPGFFTRLKNHFKNIRAELKRVMWLDRKSLKHNTGAVLFIVVTAAIVIFVFDWFVQLILGAAGFYHVKETPGSVTQPLAVEDSAIPTAAPTGGGN